MTERPASGPEKAWEAGAAGVLLALAAFLLRGYDFASNGYHAQFLPFLFRALDPDHYPGDDYVATLDGLPTPFWSLLAWACRLSGASPEAASALLFGLASWATWTSIYLLARRLSSSRLGAGLGCGLALLSPYLNAHSLLSSDTFLRTHIDPTSFGLPFALFGLWAWLSGRHAAAGALWGFLLNLQPILGAGFAACAGMAGLRRIGEPSERRSLLRMGAAFAALSLPFLAGLLGRPSPAIPSSEWAELLRLWYPWHYFPSAWPWEQWVHILLQGLVLALLGWRLARSPEGARAAILALSAAAIGLVYLPFAELWPWRPAISAQPLRLDGPAHLLLLLSAGGVLSELLREERWDSLAAAGLLWFSLAEPLPNVFPAACAAAFLVLGKGRARWLACFVLAAGTLILLGLLPLHHRFGSTAPLLLFSGLLLASNSGRAPRDLAEHPLLLAAILSSLALPFADLAWRASWIKRQKAQSAEAKLNLWIREHTPKDALLLAFNPGRDLRARSRRSVVGQWLDGAALHWQPDYGLLWKERMTELGFLLDRVPEAHRREAVGNYPVLRKGSPALAVLEPWSDDRLERLMRSYKPSFVVLPSPASRFDLELVYQGESAFVYEVVKGAKARPRRRSSRGKAKR